MTLRFFGCFLSHGQIQGFPGRLGFEDLVLSVPVVGVALGPAFGSCAGRNLPWSFSDDLRVSLDPSLQFGMGWRESEDDWKCGFRVVAMADLIGDDSVNECHFVFLV